ncbi:hypothetical protein [Streptomyces sp. NPDC000983]|uniref:hypothetical protein n=1 Tax=Streptomyces sp. NPDC000983 TaxID=3154373 RepID=UPI0033207508
MAAHFANGIPPRLLMWLRVREYAVPPSMIETATARRAAGDWAGACAAARIDPDLDLRAVRHRHGTELTARLRTDLRLLAPDLLRWHMPRIAPDGRLRPGLTLSLARYRRAGDTPLHLVVRTPPNRADAGQRMALSLWEESGPTAAGHHPHPHPDRRFRLDLHRHLWDPALGADLARRCGARSAGSPVDAGPDLGLDLDPDSGWAVGRWAAEAEVLLRAEGRARGAFTVRLGTGRHAVLELVAPDDGHVPVCRPVRCVPPAQETAVLPVLPEAASRLLPDLELLRAGLVDPSRLHPLVAAALVRGDGLTEPDEVPDPARLFGGGGDPHRVECRGEVHRIALRDGVLAAVDHDPAQLRREELLVALGGPPLPCLRAIDAVHRSPEALPAVRERLAHGDVAGALAVVEGLLGSGAVLREGPLRDALETAAARRVEHGLYRAGLVAGHPGAGGSGGSSGAGGAGGARRRPRLGRRAPFPLVAKRVGRARPRTGQAR